LVDRLIAASASSRMVNRPERGMVRSCEHHLNSDGHNHICGTAEAIVVTFCTQVGYVKSQHTDDKS